MPNYRTTSRALAWVLLALTLGLAQACSDLRVIDNPAAADQTTFRAAPGGYSL